MNHYVYQIISLTPDGNGVLKIYSGLRSCECNPEEDTEYLGSGTAITRAIEKYGREKFMKIIIGKFSTREEAHDCETAWLLKQFNFHGRHWKKFKTFNYNLRLNENDNHGNFHSPETKSKLSAVNIGKKLSEETKKKISQSNTGKKLSEETKKKLSELNRGRQVSEETRKKIGEASRVRIRMFSEETRKKMREANIGKKLSEETKKKLSELGRGRKLSEETKKKLSEVNIGKKSTLFKGLTIGTNIDTKTIVFCGNADIKSRGFTHGNISKVINGTRANHKGFVFIRTADPVQLKELLNTATFYDDESKERIEEFLKL